MQVPINPYGKAKKMAEDMIIDFSKNSDMAVMILRLVFQHHVWHTSLKNSNVGIFFFFFSPETNLKCSPLPPPIEINSRFLCKFQIFQCDWVGPRG